MHSALPARRARRRCLRMRGRHSTGAAARPACIGVFMPCGFQLPKPCGVAQRVACSAHLQRA
eukprot:6693031-Lingulodinium_polyedra.AAC.1